MTGATLGVASVAALAVRAPMSEVTEFPKSVSVAVVAQPANVPIAASATMILVVMVTSCSFHLVAGSPFGPTPEVEVRVARIDELVRRQRHAAGCDRLGEMRRDEDDQLGLSFLVIAAAEQRAQDRDRAEPRELGDRLAQLVVEQAGETHRLPVTQLYSAGRAALPQRRHESLRRRVLVRQDHAALAREFADADVDLQV